MADFSKENAQLISRNLKGVKAPDGDHRMETDSETGSTTQTSHPGLPRRAGTDVTQWGSWKQIQALEKEDQETLQTMKKEIYRMLGATKNQRNISMVVKDGLALMVELYDSISTNHKKKSSLRDVLKTEMEQATRWSPRKEAKGPTRKRIRAEELGDSSSGRDSESEFTDSTSFSQATIRGTKRGIATQASSSLAIQKRKEMVSTRKEGKPKKNEKEWKELKGKKIEMANKREEKVPKVGKEQGTKRRRSQNRRRPEALIIKVSENLPYLEVLKNLREKMKPEDTGTEIRAIRKTGKGDVLLELEGTAAISQEFRDAVSQAVGNPQAVAELTPRASVEIRDLDDLTTEEEVRSALEARLEGKGGDIKVFVTKPNSRCQRMAIVEMSEKGVDQILETSKVRIGFVSCRVRKRVQVLRCFKCLGYGHRAQDCKGTDRANMCFKCGTIGHKAATCTETVRCVLCTELGVEDTHIPGRRGCSAFRQALDRARKNLR